MGRGGRRDRLLLLFLGLLFLLVKEDRMAGWIHVSVSDSGLWHTTTLPVSSSMQVTDIHNHRLHVVCVEAFGGQAGQPFVGLVAADDPDVAVFMAG